MAWAARGVPAEGGHIQPRKSIGGLAAKPTTLGTTFDLNMKDHEMDPPHPAGQLKAQSNLKGGQTGIDECSERGGEFTQVFKKDAQLRALTYDRALWHLDMLHIAEIALFACNPLSRSFLTKETSTHKQESWPLILVRPLVPASDVGNWKCRYFLAGAYTYMVPKGTKKMADPPEEEGGLKGAPVLDQGAEESGGEGQGAD